MYTPKIRCIRCRNLIDPSKGCYVHKHWHKSYDEKDPSKGYYELMPCCYGTCGEEVDLLPDDAIEMMLKNSLDRQLVIQTVALCDEDNEIPSLVWGWLLSIKVECDDLARTKNWTSFVHRLCMMGINFDPVGSPLYHHEINSDGRTWWCLDYSTQCSVMYRKLAGAMIRMGVISKIISVIRRDIGIIDKELYKPDYGDGPVVSGKIFAHRKYAQQMADWLDSLKSGPIMEIDPKFLHVN